MKNIDSKVLIQHIEEAKDWLNRAEDEYGQANPVRGEMILNLAQAEVKYAWELSHQQFVSTRKRMRSNKKFGYLVPAVAASIILLLGLVFWPRTSKVSLDLAKESNVAKAPVLTSTNVTSGTLAKISKPDVPEKEKPVTKKPLVAALEIPVLKSKPVSKVITADNHVTVEKTKVPEKVVTVSETKQRREDENLKIQPNLQPVSQLSFDEEALTKVASHSLRNGK